MFPPFHPLRGLPLLTTKNDQTGIISTQMTVRRLAHPAWYGVQEEGFMEKVSPRNVILLASLYLGTLMIGSLILDSSLIPTGPNSNLVRALADLGPVEWGQWIMYGASAFLAAALYGRLTQGQRGTRARRFWFLMGVFFIWCLIEDAGNHRWTLGGYVRLVLDGSTHDWTSVVYMATLGLFGGITLWTHRDIAWRVVESRPFLVAGLVFFGLGAGVAEITLRTATLIFQPEHSLIHTPLILGLDLDHLEEILEYWGAAFMLASFTAHWAAGGLDKASRKSPGKKRPRK